MDVIALHQAGFDNAVASLGTSFTSGHASLLKRYTKEVYLTFDSDGAGIKEALRAIPILKEVGLSAKVINMKPYKDPDEFIKALGAEAYQDYDMKDPEGKTAFQHETAKKLAQFPEEMERNNYIEAVAEHYRMGYENLRKLVNQYGAQGGLAREPVKLKSATREVKKKEDGMKQSQKLLLTWLIEDTGLFDIVKQYITPEDFTEEIYKKAAEILYAQFAEGALNPGKIVSMFQNEEEQREIAALFNARIHEIDGKQEREKALKETILRVKENSYNYRAAHIAVTDIAGTQKLIDDKRQLEALRKLHISIN